MVEEKGGSTWQETDDARELREFFFCSLSKSFGPVA
uniref:Uncharacterized protein n=1 Tax=Nelumbo nucifera TaxID=4432 RepID=A0A822Z793_NELNU|nr:TPA_asm: hypothetical protein HUJ06_015050 [Nelumbo nucifera]